MRKQSHWAANVTVHSATRGRALPPCDVIYVSAAATAPLDNWLDALRPGGRLLFPLTPADVLEYAPWSRRDAGHHAGAGFVRRNAWDVPLCPRLPARYFPRAFSARPYSSPASERGRRRHSSKTVGGFQTGQRSRGAAAPAPPHFAGRDKLVRRGTLVAIYRRKRHLMIHRDNICKEPLWSVAYLFKDSLRALLSASSLLLCSTERRFKST